MKKRKERTDETTLKEIMNVFEGIENKFLFKAEENNECLNRKMNVEEKRIRYLKEVFLHY